MDDVLKDIVTWINNSFITAALPATRGLSMISNLYDVFNECQYDEIEDLKNDVEFLQSVDKEIADELKTVKEVPDDDYEIKTNLTNYGFMQVWQTEHYWLVNAGMRLGFGQYPKDDWTLQDAVDDQTLDEN